MVPSEASTESKIVLNVVIDRSVAGGHPSRHNLDERQIKNGMCAVGADLEDLKGTVNIESEAVSGCDRS